MTDNYRTMDDREQAIISFLLGHDFPGAAELRRQFERSLVRPLDDDGCLEIRVVSDEVAPVSQRVPTEGYFVDADGVHVNLLIHVVDGKLSELEVFKEDNSPIILKPEAADLRLAPWLGAGASD